MATKNGNHESKLEIPKAKPASTNAFPKRSAAAAVPKWSPSKPRSAQKSNAVTKQISKCSTSKEGSVRKSRVLRTKPPTKIGKLPALHYELVLKILRLAQAEKLERRSLIALRTVGTAWRLAIDNFHLPFSAEPASLWSPRQSDKYPEDDLALSPVKCFKFPQDVPLFYEMCRHPHNPFPTRELKIWCQARELPMRGFFSSYFRSVGNHLWSLTYVILPTVHSVAILFDMLRKMPYLEDLRVIHKCPNNVPSELNAYYFHPKFKLPESPQHRLKCLSVTGNRHSYLLDELLNLYGRGATLECLEIDGAGVGLSVSTLLIDNDLSNIQKLKVWEGVDDILDIFLDFGWNNSLTHVSLGVNRTAGSPILSDNLITWLESTERLEELYLYFDNLRKIQGAKWTEDGVLSSVPEVRINHSRMDSISKLGLPYKFAQLNCWRVENCRNVKHIEFHDWRNTVNRARQDANFLKFRDAEKEQIRSEVSRYRTPILPYLQKMTVLFGKSDKNSVTFSRNDLNYIDYWYC